MPDQITGGGRQRRIGRLFALIISAPQRLMSDLDVDIAGGAGHVARAHRLAPGGLHRLIKIARHIPRRRITRVGRIIMITPLQGQRIGCAARQQNLFAGHPAADLRQAHRLARKPRRIDCIRYVQLRIIGHDLGGLGQGLLERISRVVVLLHHIPTPFAVYGPEDLQ